MWTSHSAPLMSHIRVTLFSGFENSHTQIIQTNLSGYALSRSSKLHRLVKISATIHKVVLSYFPFAQHDLRRGVISNSCWKGATFTVPASSLGIWLTVLCAAKIMRCLLTVQRHIVFFMHLQFNRVHLLYVYTVWPKGGWVTTCYLNVKSTGLHSGHNLKRDYFTFHILCLANEKLNSYARKWAIHSTHSSFCSYSLTWSGMISSLCWLLANISKLYVNITVFGTLRRLLHLY